MATVRRAALKRPCSADVVLHPHGGKTPKVQGWFAFQGHRLAEEDCLKSVPGRWDSSSSRSHSQSPGNPHPLPQSNQPTGTSMQRGFVSIWGRGGVLPFLQK